MKKLARTAAIDKGWDEEVGQGLKVLASWQLLVLARSSAITVGDPASRS